LYSDLRKTRRVLEKTLEDVNTASVFFIGSQSTFATVRPAAGLSDLDLLITADSDSIADYERNLERVGTLKKDLGSEADLFFLSKDILPLHMTCLSVLMGIDNTSDKRALFYGKPISSLPPSNKKKDLLIRHLLYKAQAISMLNDLNEKLPVADTEYARHVAKSILKALKVICCALSPVNELTLTEKQLKAHKNFDGILSVFYSLTGRSLTVPDTLKEALTHEKILDWAGWMVAQENLIAELLEYKAELSLSEVKEDRLVEAIVSVRNMLLLDLHGIIDAPSIKKQHDLISDYADKTASVLVRLAVNGVSDLADLTSHNTPGIVTESYAIIVKHLQRKHPDITCLAASIVLLEYALKSSLKFKM
jgi:hypothetical protein